MAGRRHQVILQPVLSTNKKEGRAQPGTDQQLHGSICSCAQLHMHCTLLQGKMQHSGAFWVQIAPRKKVGSRFCSHSSQHTTALACTDRGHQTMGLVFDSEHTPPWANGGLTFHLSACHHARPHVHTPMEIISTTSLALCPCPKTMSQGGNVISKYSMYRGPCKLIVCYVKKFAGTFVGS